MSLVLEGVSLTHRAHIGFSSGSVMICVQVKERARRLNSNTVIQPIPAWGPLSRVFELCLERSLLVLEKALIGMMRSGANLKSIVKFIDQISRKRKAEVKN